jgi:hypothetical protein
MRNSKKVLDEQQQRYQNALRKEEIAKDKKANKLKFKSDIKNSIKGHHANLKELRNAEKKKEAIQQSMSRKRHAMDLMLMTEGMDEQSAEYIKMQKRLSRQQNELFAASGEIGAATKKVKESKAQGTQMAKEVGKRSMPLKGVGKNIKKLWNAENKKKKIWAGIKVMTRLVGKAFMMILPMLGYAILGIFAIIGIVALVKALWEGIKESFNESKETIMNTIQYIIDGFMMVYDGAMMIWSAIAEGDWMGMLEGVATIAVGLIDIALGLLWLSVLGLWVVAKGIWNTWWAWVKKDMWTNLFKTFIVLIAVYFTWWLISAIAVTAGLPVLVVVGIIAGLFAVGAWILKKMKFWADGGPASGLGVVGEKGPELVNMPAGSRVYSNKESKKMIGKGGGSTVININVNGRVGASDAEIRDIASKLGKHINNELFRTTG